MTNYSEIIARLEREERTFDLELHIELAMGATPHGAGWAAIFYTTDRFAIRWFRAPTRKEEG